MTAHTIVGVDPGLSFTVPGKAQPAGSKRALPLGGKHGGRPIVVDANKHAKPWKAVVAAYALAARTSPELLDGPLAVTFRFVRERPKGHYGKRGLRSNAPAFPEVRPDVLKLARAVEDALTGIIWRDDAQIVDERLLKVYGDPERVEINIRTLATAGEERA